MSIVNVYSEAYVPYYNGYRFENEDLWDNTDLGSVNFKSYFWGHSYRVSSGDTHTFYKRGDENIRFGLLIFQLLAGFSLILNWMIVIKGVLLILPVKLQLLTKLR
jgi:hypothetical protein